MSLHRHKVRARPGSAEAATVALVLAAVVFMIVGPVLLPGRDWTRARGEVLEASSYRNSSTPDGRPFHVRLTYRYYIDGMPYDGAWDGEWPEAHSPNALLSSELFRLEETGYSLVVFHDPEDPARSNLHLDGNRASAWWLRISIVLAALALWCIFVIYPRLKSGRRA